MFAYILTFKSLTNVAQVNSFPCLSKTRSIITEDYKKVKGGNSGHLTDVMVGDG